jgi:ABC-type molybdate transport system substrate-binding protein
MKRFLAFSLFVVVVLSACTAPAATEQAANATQQVDITVFKAPY